MPNLKKYPPVLWSIQFVVITASTICFFASESYGDIFILNNSANAIQRSNNDGSGLVSLIPEVQNGARFTSITVDEVGRKLYWGENRGIRQANLDGTGVGWLIEGLPFAPTALAFDTINSIIYSIIPQGGVNYNLGVINPDGTGRNDSLASVNGDIVAGLAIEVSAQQLFVTRGNFSDDILRLNTDGTGLTQLVSDAIEPRAIVADSAAGLFWSNNRAANGIVSSGLDGSNITTIVPDDTVALGLDLEESESKLYWVEGTDGGQVRRSNLDGSEVETLIDGLGLNSFIDAGGLVVTSTSVPEPSALTMLGVVSACLLSRRRKRFNACA